MHMVNWLKWLGTGTLVGIVALWAVTAALGAEPAASKVRQASTPATATKPPAYVGTEACKECHETEYQSYKANSKKAHSFKSVKRLSHALSEEEMKQCYECHTTGYGKPGGFISERETPKMADAGCEACHGPGGLHVQTQSIRDIKATLKPKDCMGCHNAERIEAFNFRPTIHSGGH